MKGKPNFRLLFAAAAIFMLIIDSKTALTGANDGIQLCLNSIIPSLFPFFFLSMILTSSLWGINSGVLRPIGRMLRISPGSEPLVLIGLLGGYPVGAQCVAQACESGQIASEDGERMLAFCNNCGPAFIFGILSRFFEESWILWALWGIHVISAMLAGMTIPGKSTHSAIVHEQKLSISMALQRSIAAMAQVCGWVILFRILIATIDRWVGFLIPSTAKAAIWGLLELTNGCFSLNAVTDTGLRFMLCSAMLSLGGLCVAMQTVGVVANRLSLRLYFPGKALQCLYATGLSAVVCSLAFDGNYYITTGIVSATIVPILIFFHVFEKKSSILHPIRV